jgi:6-pyruvoyltetrahydropterin/6-carboxytetrahydropterin synthase
MKFEISQSFGFEAAHTLIRSVPVDEFSASARVHGHSYMARVAVTGERGKAGMVKVLDGGKRVTWKSVDLFYLREALADVRQELDHQLLNDVPGLEYGTLECLCEFIAAKIGRNFPVAWVEVSRPSTGDACRVTP